MKTPPLLAQLLLVICFPLPESQRTDRYRDWLGQCEESPRPYLEAISMVPAVIGLCWQYEPDTALQGKVHWYDRFTVFGSKTLVILLALVILCYAGFLTLLGQWTPEAVHWVQTRLLTVTVGAWVAWAGLSHDVPWLRSTWGGSALNITLILLPLVIAALCPSTQSFMDVVWLATLYALMTWDAYWATQRPLKRTGLLARRR